MIYCNIRNLTTYNIVSAVCRVPDGGLARHGGGDYYRWESEVGVHTTQPRYHSIIIILH